MKWTLKLIAETAPGIVTEHEIAQIERGEPMTPESLGLSIAEGKSLLAVVQVLLVTSQVQQHGERVRSCPQCPRKLATKGYYQSTFRSVFGNVRIRVRRLLTCPCQGVRKSVSTVSEGNDPNSPELSYLTAKLAALMPFGKVADFLAEVLPVSAKTNACTVRNRAMRVGKRLEYQRDQPRGAVPASAPKEVILGLDGGYVRNRHPRPERNFEIIVGKVLGEQAGQQQRFAFVRGLSSPGIEEISSLFRNSGVDSSTNITVLSDGDAGLRSIQRKVAPNAQHILDWFHIAMRFQNMLQLGKALYNQPATWEDGCWVMMKLNRAKWSLWNGQGDKTVAHLIAVHAWTLARGAETPSGIARLQKPLYEMLNYLFANEDSLPNYAERYRLGQLISSSWVESAVNEIVSKRMAKKQQMRWNRATVQPFLTVRTCVLNETLENAFRHWHPTLRSSHSAPVQLAAA